MEENDKIYQKVENLIKNDPDLDSYMLTSGGSGMSLSTGGATLTAYLKDDRERETGSGCKRVEEAAESGDRQPIFL